MQLSAKHNKRRNYLISKINYNNKVVNKIMTYVQQKRPISLTSKEGRLSEEQLRTFACRCQGTTSVPNTIKLLLKIQKFFTEN